MRKIDELSDPRSCWNKARHDEWLFIILGRDETFAAIVRAWAAERIKLGKNEPGDRQIVNALTLAQSVEDEQRR